MDVKAAVGICNCIVQDLSTVQVILNFNGSLTQKRVMPELEVSSKELVNQCCAPLRNELLFHRALYREKALSHVYGIEEFFPHKLFWHSIFFKVPAVPADQRQRVVLAVGDTNQ